MNKEITVKCLECAENFQAIKYYHGHQEICNNCIKERDLRDRCKRHLGRDGLNCFLCKLEAKF